MRAAGIKMQSHRQLTFLRSNPQRAAVLSFRHFPTVFRGLRERPTHRRAAAGALNFIRRRARSLLSPLPPGISCQSVVTG